MIMKKCLWLILVTNAIFSHVFAFSSSSSLGAKSTALDVWDELNHQNNLASYVHEDATAVVTGGNSGIGAETVKTLARTGMNVVLCARNKELGLQTLQKVPKWCRDNVSIQTLDLADMDTIQRAAQEIQETHKSSIDLLCNNAGVMALPKRLETKNGIEMQVGVNHVGHHMLTRLLLPSMNENGRIVNVASTAHQFCKGNGDWNSEQSYSAWGTYGTSKLANILFAKSLQDKLNDIDRRDIRSVSLHPGVIKTNLWRNTPSLLQFASNMFADKTVEQGAATNVYCSLVEELQGGAYYQDCQVATPSATAQGTSLRQDLWSYTENLIKRKGFELPSTLMETERETIAEIV